MGYSTPLTRDLSSVLHTEFIGRVVRGYDQVSSTNSTAMVWAAEGAPEGSIVTAELQTSGRGRLGRTWIAEPGKNLTFSIILRPSLLPDSLPLITLAASISVAQVVEETIAPVEPAIKWPNDILIDRKKCCGMLLESTFEATPGPGACTVVLGIGLNVNQDHFPREISIPATSLLLESGRFIPRAPLLASLLLQFEHNYKRLLEGYRDAIRNEYTSRLFGKGESIRLRLTGVDETVTGTLLGIAKDGALRLDTPSGLRTFYAGDVTTH